MKEKRLTKTERVLRHLQEFGSITSWEAIKEYGATRLSAIIYTLKKKGYIFEDETIEFTDRYGYPGHFKKYILTGKLNKGEEENNENKERESV